MTNRLPSLPAFAPSRAFAMGRARPWAASVLAALGVLAALWFAGPRYAFGPDEPAPREQPPAALAQIDDWLVQQEAMVAGVRPGTAKGIVWYGAARQRTPWAVVYLHGFTASRVETWPLAERAAQALGANLFYTRLAGHGLPPEALRTVTPQDWLADAVEAVRIGHAIGERVLVVGTSTGAAGAQGRSVVRARAGAGAVQSVRPNRRSAPDRSGVRAPGQPLQTAGEGGGQH
ncbi:MAG: alpha/beta hydrolase [Tepidimonas sp.]|uniref:alpha/beta hydrolase n=1 Tax=Tepidimonas sp. TaxID=2002775 RepID=UPI004054FBB7